MTSATVYVLFNEVGFVIVSLRPIVMTSFHAIGQTEEPNSLQ